MAISKLGDRNPAKRPEVAAKIRASLLKLTYKRSGGRFVGPQHPNWKGGEIRRADGYVLIWVPPPERHKWPNHHRGHIFRSHVVWNAAHPNDPRLPGEVIHHLNGIKDDDRPENLAKLRSQGEHFSHHARLLASVRKRDDKGHFL